MEKIKEYVDMAIEKIEYCIGDDKGMEGPMEKSDGYTPSDSDSGDEMMTKKMEKYKMIRKYLMKAQEKVMYCLKGSEEYQKPISSIDDLRERAGYEK